MTTLLMRLTVFAALATGLCAPAVAQKAPASQPASQPAKRRLRPAELALLKKLGHPTSVAIALRAESAPAGTDRRKELQAAVNLFVKNLQAKTYPNGLEWATRQTAAAHPMRFVLLWPGNTSIRNAEVMDTLGVAETTTADGFLDKGNPTRKASPTAKPLTWVRYGPLSLGICDQRVQLVRVMVDALPDGKSAAVPPDRPERPARPAGEVVLEPPKEPEVPARWLKIEEKDALDLLGHAVGYQVFGDADTKPQVAALRKAMVAVRDSLKNRRLVTGMGRAAETLQKHPGVRSVLITPSKEGAAFAPIVKILGTPDAVLHWGYWSANGLTSVKAAGKPVSWFCYTWMQLGVSEGKVRLLRINPAAIPKPQDD